MSIKDILETLSYVSTIVGFPLAILIFMYEQRKERLNEEDEVYQSLSDNYQDFLKVVLDNTDLHLFTPEETQGLSSEQQERMFLIFSMLIALFERAYLMLYKPKLNAIQKRRWASWEDYMREWCKRKDFANLLEELLNGEDPEFSRYILRIKESNK